MAGFSRAALCAPPASGSRAPPGQWSPAAPVGQPEGHDASAAQVHAPLASLVSRFCTAEPPPCADSTAHVQSTTMAILNVPYAYPTWKLQWDINQEGLPYDYFHCPRDTRKERSRGFAFVNFTSPEAAEAFRLSFNHRKLCYPGTEAKVVTVLPSLLQGLEENSRLHPRGLKPISQNRPQLTASHDRHRAQHSTTHAAKSRSSFSSSPVATVVPLPPSQYADGVVLCRLSF